MKEGREEDEGGSRTVSRVHKVKTTVEKVLRKGGVRQTSKGKVHEVGRKE